MFEREDWKLFRTLATLSQKAGVTVAELPALVAKELADNALDTLADCRVGLLPDNGFWVEDDGEGIEGTDEEIAELFSIGRPLRSTKLRRLPTRGALGNGLRVVAGAVLASGGSLRVRTKGRTLWLQPQDDGTTLVQQIGRSDLEGTRIEVTFGPALKVTSSTLDWAWQAAALGGGESRYSGKSSPHWYDSESFYELLQAAGRITVRDLVEKFDGGSGPKAGAIAAAFKQRVASELSRDEADQLLATARAKARVVKPERLGCLGQAVGDWPRGYARVTGICHHKAARGQHHAEVPFVVEAFAEVSDGEADFEVCVNRTPITTRTEAYHHKEWLVVTGCGLERQFRVGRRTIRARLNIETPYMPITSDGKAPDLTKFLRAISEALEKAVGRAKRRLAAHPEPKGPTAEDIILRHLDRAVDKAGGSGVYRFSHRQLFYVIRPFVIEALDVQPEYGYFGKVITEYEADHGDIPGMYRDPRGTVYHPHTGEEIRLGTMQVASYRRPPFTFNKVLDCEKEGIFPILKAAQWPEKHDCALMTSKGFASRAARDLIDLLGETGEELIVFCIHDADASGTLIYQALQEATRARPGRKVRIINLGLEPAEARAMGLQIEEVKRDGTKRLPVADYVDEAEQEWLQGHRVELNAMTSPELLAWLDRKMEPYCGKVIPPDEVLTDRL